MPQETGDTPAQKAKDSSSVDFLGGMVVADRLILTNLYAENAEEVLARLAGLMQQSGYARNGFYEALLERERNFPTGLLTQTLPVAIPHADPEYVEEPALGIAILKEPVLFHLMDEPQQTSPVRLVFLVALKTGGAQIEFLRRFCLALRSDAFLPGLLELDSPAAVRELVIRELANAEERE